MNILRRIFGHRPDPEAVADELIRGLESGALTLGREQSIEGAAPACNVTIGASAPGPGPTEPSAQTGTSITITFEVVDDMTEEQRRVWEKRLQEQLMRELSRMLDEQRRRIPKNA